MHFPKISLAVLFGSVALVLQRADSDLDMAMVYRLQDGRYIKRIDVSGDKVEFDLGKCSIQFDFAKIWM